MNMLEDNRKRTLGRSPLPTLIAVVLRQRRAHTMVDKLITSFLTKCQCWEPECGSRSLDKKDKKAQPGDADRFPNVRSPSTVRGRGGGQLQLESYQCIAHAVD